MKIINIEKSSVPLAFAPKCHKLWIATKNYSMHWISRNVKSPIDLVRKGNSLKSKLHFQQHKNLLEIALFFNIILGKLKGSLLVNTEVQASLLTSIKIIIDPRLLYSLCCSLFLDKGHK